MNAARSRASDWRSTSRSVLIGAAGQGTGCTVISSDTERFLILSTTRFDLVRPRQAATSDVAEHRDVLRGEPVAFAREDPPDRAWPRRFLAGSPGGRETLDSWCCETHVLDREAAADLVDAAVHGAGHAGCRSPARHPRGHHHRPRRRRDRGCARAGPGPAAAVPPVRTRVVEAHPGQARATPQALTLCSARCQGPRQGSQTVIIAAGTGAVSPARASCMALSRRTTRIARTAAARVKALSAISSTSEV